MKRYIPLILLCLSLIYSCKDDAEIPGYQFYKILTDAPQVDRDGVTFSATIEMEGKEEVTERGFVIYRQFASATRPEMEIHNVSLDGEFQLRLEDDWDAGVTSSVYAYMKTTNYNYKGEKRNFVTKGSKAPEIYSVTMVNDEYFRYLVIKGAHFSAIKSRNKVYLNNLEYHIVKSSPTELRIELYVSEIGSYDLRVEVGAEMVEIENGYHLDGPKIKAVYPDKMVVGDIVTIELEGYSLGMDVDVMITDTGGTALIIEKSETYLKCIFRNMEDGKANSFYLYFPNRRISTPKQEITLIKQWGASGDVMERDVNQYIIHEDEAYGINHGNVILHYNKRNNQWEKLTSYPVNELYETILFAQGDYLYVGGGRPDLESSFIYKYSISTGQWEECQHAPERFAYFTYGEWINGEYYVNVKYQTKLIKYTPESDEWTIVNERLDAFYRFFAVDDQVYALSDDTLYEYDIHLQQRGEPVYKFPSYIQFSSDEMYRNGDIICFPTRLTLLSSLWQFNLSTKELKSLGSPNKYSDYYCILPFRESLLGAAGGRVYKYIGDRYNQ